MAHVSTRIRGAFPGIRTRNTHFQSHLRARSLEYVRVWRHGGPQGIVGENGTARIANNLNPGTWTVGSNAINLYILRWPCCITFSTTIEAQDIRGIFRGVDQFGNEREELIEFSTGNTVQTPSATLPFSYTSKYAYTLAREFIPLQQSTAGASFDIGFVSDRGINTDNALMSRHWGRASMRVALPFLPRNPEAVVVMWKEQDIVGAVTAGARYCYRLNPDDFKESHWMGDLAGLLGIFSVQDLEDTWNTENAGNPDLGAEIHSANFLVDCDRGTMLVPAEAVATDTDASYVIGFDPKEVIMRH